MPYISKADRPELNEGQSPRTPGELNYAITRAVLKYLCESTGCTLGAMPTAVRYQHINDVIGALEAAKLEFYRRFAAPYEDEKIVQNGDVYP